MKSTVYTKDGVRRTVHFVSELQECNGLLTNQAYICGICEAMRWILLADDEVFCDFDYPTGS